MSENKANRLFLTNNYSIISKYSAVKKGYFVDKALEAFVDCERCSSPRSRHRTPLINRGYAARLLAIDRTIKRAIKFDGVDCFIVLGAGYDTTAFRYLDGNCCWIELDLPQVVDVKSKIIQEEEILKDLKLIKVEDRIFRCTNFKYHLVACDLRDTKRLSGLLNSILLKVGKRKNISIVNEVCLCYLDQEEVLAILKTVIDSTKDQALNISYIGFEQIRPDVENEFSKIMTNHFSSHGYPLKYFPTAKEVRRLLLDLLNFDHVTITPMHQVYHNILLDDRLETEAFKKEPFDEFEEMDSYLSHYALVTGLLVLKNPFYNLNKHKLQKQYESDEELSERLDSIGIIKEDGNQHSAPVDISLINSPIQRFGHASCLFEGSLQCCSIIVTGGFGRSSSSESHQRLNDCILLRQGANSSLVSTSIKPDEHHFHKDSISLDRMHGQVSPILSSGLFFFNGGRQSPVKRRDSNVSFIASIENDELICKHRFDHRQTDQVFRWRHRQATGLSTDQLIQVGGLGTHGRQLVTWNFSSSKLGFTQEESELLDRHSFGMDSRNDILIVYGGLRTSIEVRERPVDCDISAILIDMRTKKRIQALLEPASCYGSDIHFISDNQLVRVGGVSCDTGLADSCIEKIDLRSGGKISEHLKVSSMMLMNSTSCVCESQKKVFSVGGGGNYFTFGSYFNQKSIVYHYS